MLSLYINTYTLLIYISLLLIALIISTKHSHTLRKKAFLTYTSFKQTALWVLTLLAASHGFGVENPWCVLAGILYLIFCISIAPIVLKDVKADNIPDCIDRYYGAGPRIIVSVVSLIYISLKLGSYASLIYNDVIVLDSSTHVLLLLIAAITSLALLFHLEGIIWLQALLFALFITVLPLFVRENVYLAGSTVSWAKWLAKTSTHILQYPWQDAIIYILPTNLLAGHVFLLSHHKKQLKKALFISILLSLTCMAPLLFTQAQDVGIKANYSFVYHSALGAWYIFLISQLFYIGSTFLSHGIIKHLSPTASTSKLASLMVVGWSILLIATPYYSSYSLLNTLSKHMLSGVIPCQVAFLAGITGFTPAKKTFYTTVSSSIITYFLGIALGISIAASCILSIVASTVAFGITHYSIHQGVSFVKRKWQETKALQAYKHTWIETREYIKKLLLFPIYIASLSRESVSTYGSKPFTFSLFFCLSSYIFPFFITPFEAQASYQTLTLIQYIGFLLSLGLLLYPYWSKTFLHYFPLYWHITLGYCLPFSASLTYLLVGGPNTLLINLAITTMLLASLVDGASFILLNLIGIALSIGLAQHMTIARATLDLLLQDTDKLYILLYTYALSSLVGFFFLRKNHEERHRTNEIVQIFCRNLMHKLTNVTGIVRSYASLLLYCQKSMKTIPEKEKGAFLISMDKAPYEMMNEVITLLDEKSATGQTILRDIITPIRANVEPGEFASYSIAACIKEGIAHYSLQDEEFDQLDIDVKDDFTFWGNDKYLVQVIYTLLKNSHMHVSKKCKVAIWLKNNKIYYQDNGPGISPIHIPYIFDNFYSTSSSIGMGLAYVRKVIKVFKGDIVCQTSTNTEKGTYTRFIMTLPKRK